MGLLKSTISDARVSKSSKTMSPVSTSDASAKTHSKTTHALNPLNNQISAGKTVPAPDSHITQVTQSAKPRNDDLKSRHYSPVEILDKLNSHSHEDNQANVLNNAETDHSAKKNTANHKAASASHQQPEHKTTIATYEIRPHKVDSLSVLPSIPVNNTIINKDSNNIRCDENSFIDKKYSMNTQAENLDKVTAKYIQHKHATLQPITSKKVAAQADSKVISRADSSKKSENTITTNINPVYAESSKPPVHESLTDQQVFSDKAYSKKNSLTYKQDQQTDIQNYHDNNHLFSTHSSERKITEEITAEQVNNRQDSFSRRSIESPTSEIGTQKVIPYQEKAGSPVYVENSINEIHDQQADVLMQMKRTKAEQAELHSEINEQASTAAVWAQVIDNYSIVNNQLRNNANSTVNVSTAPARQAEVKIGQVDVFIEPPHRSESRHASTSRPSPSMASRYYLRRL